MVDDDVTRMLSSPDEEEFEGQGFTARGFEAGAPCVGVSSMGITHFGETQVGTVGEDEASERLGSSDISSVGRRPSRSIRRREGRSPNEGTSHEPSWRSRLRRVRFPPWVGALLGCLLGLGGALLVIHSSGGGAPGETSPAEPGSEAIGIIEQEVGTEVLIQVADDAEQPIAEVFVRAGDFRGITGDDGVASLSIPKGEPLRLHAECPEGTRGPVLVRDLTARVLAASPRWDFELSCVREVVEQTLSVSAKGCGEVKVFVDDVSVGVTQDGALSYVRKIREAGSVQVAVEPIEGKCTFEPNARQIAFDRMDTNVSVEFSGKRPVSRSRARPVTKKQVVRPYRL